MTDVPTTQEINTIRLTDVPILRNLVRAWLGLSWLHRALIGLIVLRLVTALLIMTNVLPLPADMRFGWHLHHGGDQDIMFNLARSIIAGSPAKEVVGLGQSLVMIPFILWLNPAQYTDIVVPLVLINGFLLAGLSILMIGILVKHITGSDRVAFWSAAFWTALPVLTYLATFWNLALRGVFVPRVGWLNGLSDAPAAFFMLLAVMILAQCLKSEGTPVKRMLILGFTLGIAITFRFHIIPMVLVLAVYTLVVHGWRSLLLAVLGGLIAYIPQGWYNWVVFKLIFTTGYLAYYRYNIWTGEARTIPEMLATLPFAPENITHFLNQYLEGRLWLLIPMVLGLAALVITTIILWKRQGWRSVTLLIIVPLSYLLPMMLTWPFREDPVRFSIPAMPFFIAIGFYALWLVVERLPKASAQPVTRH